jgi:hypothetical protein
MVLFLSRCGRQGIRSLFHGLDQVLNGINLTFFEVSFAALLANPGRDTIEQHMASFAVNVKRGCALLHLASAVNTFHHLALIRKPFVHLVDGEVHSIGQPFTKCEYGPIIWTTNERDAIHGQSSCELHVTPTFHL